MDDSQIRFVRGLKNGDKRVFEEMYREYYTPLCRYCIRMVGKPEEAEEIVQGLFLKLWVKRRDLVINSSLQSYLYRAVQNHSINHLNQKKLRGQTPIDEVQEPEHDQMSAQEHMEEHDLTLRIQKAIAGLPDKRRQIFELSRFHELRYQQIADTLNISVKTVEAQMAKALQTLRIVLKDYLTIILLVTNVVFFK